MKISLRPKNASTIRFQMACLVLAAVLPVWLVSGFLVFHAYSVKRDQVSQNMQETARSLTMVVERDLSSVQAALTALATSPGFASGDFHSVHVQVMELLKFYPGADIIVADSTGQQLVNSARPYGSPLPKRNNPDTVRRIFETGRPIISDLFFGALTKRPLVSIDVPVMGENKVLYDLAMTFPSDRLDAILKQQRIPSEWYSVILDSKPVVVARSRFSERYVGKRANPVHQSLAHLPEGTTEYTNIEGKQVLVAFCRSTLSRWNVVIGVPKASVMAEIYRWTGWAVAGSTLISLFGIALALRFARRITLAIHSLVDPALAIGRGETVAPFPTHGVEEIGAVATALVQASDLLQARAAELSHYLGVLQQEMAERQLSEESLRRLVDGAKDYAIIMLSVDGRVTSWNEGAQRLKGWGKAEVLGMHFSAFYPEEAVAAGRPDSNLGLAASEGRYAEEGWRMRKDRSRFLADVIITAVRDDQGTLRGFSSVTRDITERKQAEQRLQATLEELERSNKELEQFAYVASHDLQEPLRMVSSYTQLLAQRYEDQLDEKAKKFIDYAVDGAVRMQTLINDLLTYSRVSTQGRTFEEIDSRATLEEALRNLTAAIAETGAVVVSGELPRVPADASQLSQVFQNLIGNAMKFRSSEVPQISISASDLGRAWRFSVKDNGIGIQAQYAEKVFVIFQRLHTRLEYPGTGIGLAICKRIVERHGGSIWFESEQGRGSTFHFTIPKKRRRHE
jgi:PAS domain S-box-containing protein